MIPLIIALTSAVLFLSLSILAYGADVLTESAWVAMVFWGLIGSGLVVYLANRPTPRWCLQLRDRIADITGRDCPAHGH